MEWISVKDRIPKEGERVLCFDLDCNICIVYWIYHEDQWYHHREGLNSEDNSLYRVTHWMPLPKQPKVK